MNFITNTLSKDAFWQINKGVAKHLRSNDAAILLSELIFLHKQHPEREMVYANQERLMQNCNLTLHGLRSSMKLLIDCNLVYSEKKKEFNDVSPKNYYRVHQDEIYKILNSYDDRSAGIQSTGEQTTSVSIETDNRSAEILSTGDQDFSAQNNNLINNKEGINKEVWINLFNKSNVKDLVNTPDRLLTKEELKEKSELIFQ